MIAFASNMNRAWPWQSSYCWFCLTAFQKHSGLDVEGHPHRHISKYWLKSRSWWCRIWCIRLTPFKWASGAPPKPGHFRRVSTVCWTSMDNHGSLLGSCDAWRLNPLRWRINWKTSLTSRDLFPWKLNYFCFFSIGGAPAKTSVLVMKLVMQEMMHTFDSFQMGLRGSVKTWPFPQGITCVLDINGQSRQFVGLMWRLMFESPSMENQLEDIVNLNGSFFLKINNFFYLLTEFFDRRDERKWLRCRRVTVYF